METVVLNLFKTAILFSRRTSDLSHSRFSRLVVELISHAVFVTG